MPSTLVTPELLGIGRSPASLSDDEEVSFGPETMWVNFVICREF